MMTHPRPTPADALTSAISTRPVRVLMVVQRYFPELGGLETHVAEVSRRLAARADLELTVLTTDRSGRLPARERMAGYEVLRRRSWPRDRDYYFSPGLPRVIARGEWDVIHFQGVHTLVAPLGMLAANAAGVPYVLSMHSGGHSSGLRSAGRGLQWRLLTPLLARADRLIAVSRFERASFAAATGLAPQRFAVIPNGGALPLVPDDVRPVPGRILSSGRLERYKGHHRVIEALARLRRDRPDAHVVILGSGPYGPDLRALADRLGLGSAVQFRSVPPEDRAAMARELAAAQVMAALSSYEAHPVAVMEALTVGLPVIGCDVAGIADLVEDGLVTPVALDASTEQLARSLGAALQAAAAAAGSGRRGPLTSDLPTWESSAEALAGIYRQVLADRAGP